MPSPPVVVVRTAPVSTLVAVTVAFGTTAPEGSLTVPASAPVEDVWAIKGDTDINVRHRNKVSSAPTTARQLLRVFFVIIPWLLLHPRLFHQALWRTRNATDERVHLSVAQVFRSRATTRIL